MKSKIKVYDPNDDEMVVDDNEIPLVHKMPVPNRGVSSRFLYCGRMISKDHFRAWVYGKDGRKMANNYDDFVKLVATGLWFESIEAMSKASEKEKKEVKVVKKVKKEVKPEVQVTLVDELPVGGVIEYGANG